MSALAKKLHVHFDDDVSNSSTSKLKSMEEIFDREKSASTLNYTRDELLELAKNKLSKEPPKFPHDMDADEKRKQKIKCVLKNADVLKNSYEKNGVENTTVISEGGVGNKNATHTVNERDRTDFQQLIAAAVTNAQQQNKIDYAGQENRRRRIGSGRIIENNHYQYEQNNKNNNNFYPMGMDVRYMRNELFRETNNDGKRTKNWKTGNEFGWNNMKMMSHTSVDSDNTDAKSDEPEWANVGVSKSDIIELHGFDGPSTVCDDDKLKADNSSENTSVTLPARSTPSKPIPKTDASGKLDDYFNFEDFLKLDLPSNANNAREHDKGESRFSQWFGQTGSPNRNKINGNFYDIAGSQNQNVTSAQQLFNLQQKSNLKKMTTFPNLANAGGKVRSVGELEADWCPNPNPNTQAKKSDFVTPQDLNAFRCFLNQLNMATSAGGKQHNSTNAAQSNYLLNLINKNTEDLYQNQWSEDIVMKRPDAQLFVHRLVNGEITQLHILQQLSNPRIHQRDRETLFAVLNFCNRNQQWLQQQQQLNLKHKEFISQQLRQLQMWQMKNTQARPPTPQELQVHTQNIMQNAVLKKQFEEQYRRFQGGSKPNYNVRYQPNKMNQYQRFNQKPKHYQPPQDGLQFIQSQSKPLWARQNGNNHPTLPVYGINDGGHLLNNNPKFPNDLLSGAMQQFFGRNGSPSNLPGAADVNDDGIAVGK